MALGESIRICPALGSHLKLGVPIQKGLVSSTAYHGPLVVRIEFCGLRLISSGVFGKSMRPLVAREVKLVPTLKPIGSCSETSALIPLLVRFMLVRVKQM